MKKLSQYLFIILLSTMIFACSDAPGNNAPVLNTVDAQSTLEDTAKTLILFGTYKEGSSLTYSATSSTSNVTISVSGSTLTLTPAANWNGTATITAKVNNGIVDSSAKTFTLTVSAVNDAPVLASISAQTTNEDTAKTLTLSGTDVDAGDTLTYSATSSTTNVTIGVSGTTLTLTPASNWDGTATITATVNDGTVDSSAQTFVLTVYAFQSGDGFNDKVYLTVTSPDTGRVWLDRNLGATQVCTSSTDSDCYGYVYQWGRNDDGHEIRTSSTTTTLASTITPGTDTFIISTDPNNDWTTADSLGSSRTSAWIDAGVNDVCPAGYSVPTEAELTADSTEATTTDITDAATAYSSFLKLPVGGDRVAETGNMARVDSFGWLWTRSILDSEARVLGYNAGIATFVDTDKGISLSVRCIKDL